MEQMIVGATNFSLLLALKEEAEKRGFVFDPGPGRNAVEERYWCKEDYESERHLDFYDKYSKGKTFSFSNNNEVTHTLPKDWDKVIARLDTPPKLNIEVMLNPSYKATVTKDKVIVGCQELSRRISFL